MGTVVVVVVVTVGQVGRHLCSLGPFDVGREQN